MSTKLAVPDQEFALVPVTDPRRIQRRWLSVVAGGHVSGVTWGNPPIQTVLLHDAGRSARSFDRLLFALDRPALALDLPGHGRSNWRNGGDYAPRRLAGATAEAIRSFAPAARLVVGAGLGALTAIALTIRRPEQVGALVLLDTLPGSGVGPVPSDSPRYASQEEALDELRRIRPEEAEADLADDVRYETAQEPDETWAWRHHLGNLPADAAGNLDDATLWEPLAALAARQIPVVLVRPAEGGRLSDEAVAEFRRRVPTADVVAAGEPELPQLLRDLLDQIQRSTV
ncbi:alpha/beta hydrolase [Planotetraspora sp. A-T 1434]|uniref:alpha/beta fold hydrolase n=1 Tax=Planotetraspora sp. A-T 1434 TaxID=2979219 RepID=UPI0021C236A1|nr:alpha/beta hydrolase [Planotetraspora sp. A-T 1434]MCT9934444.1 alpha/beta hydrolase [Planotetraspora sp. A-T 1434]